MKIPDALARKLPVPRAAAYTAAILLALFIFDLSRLPARQVSARVLLFFIGGYQRHVSHHLKGVVRCKFQPTCSHYGKTSIEWYGAFWGTLKTADRLFRCSPWCTQEGEDPP